jgi:hypothetical protein
MSCATLSPTTASADSGAFGVFLLGVRREPEDRAASTSSSSSPARW